MSTQEYRKLRDELVLYLESNNIGYQFFIDSVDDLVGCIIVREALTRDHQSGLFDIFNSLECDVMDLSIVNYRQIEIFPFESESNE